MFHGDIMSEWKCCDFGESHLLCDLPKALTDKTHAGVWLSSCYQKNLPKHKNAS